MKIHVIEPVVSENRKLRVGAYCRVSTDAEEQENSLDNQIKHYRDLIEERPDYEFVKVYYDYGVSGFKEKQRTGFQEMMQDAREGRIDLILTKSISRFARNTDIVLRSTRELKELNVGVFFELQNINTLSAKGELMMTIVAAFAQEESVSSSLGAKMVYQRKYEAGIPVQYLERSFGYKKDASGMFIADDKEAKWVKKIYEMIAEGYTISAVARFMNDQGVKTVGGAEWTASTVVRIIENEIYKGDYIMHKYFVNEDRKLVKNRGEVDSWYITEDHEPIVSKGLWEKAQEAMNVKRDYLSTPSDIREMTEENYPYKEKLFCDCCGYPLKPRIYSNGNRMNWGCSGAKRYGKGFCPGVNVPDGVIKEWDIDGNIYIFERPGEKGIKEYRFHKESYWKRYNKVKQHTWDVEPNTKESYPYKDRIFCKHCGGPLVRYISKGNRVHWICNTTKRKGKSVCPGVRISDEVIRSWMPFNQDIYISKRRRKSGEEYYSHTCQKPKIKS